MSIINAIQIGVVETWSARMKFVRVRRGGQAGIWRAGDTKLTQQNIHEPPVNQKFQRAFALGHDLSGV